MSKNQTSLENFFEKGGRPNDETADDSKTANKMKAAFTRKHQDFLVARWLRIRLPMQRTQARSLVREDPTCRRATKPMCHNY